MSPPTHPTLQVQPLVENKLRTGLYEKCIQAIGMQLFGPGIFFFVLDREFALLLVREAGNRLEEPRFCGFSGPYWIVRPVN